ncbi:PQQ-like beta-propeller repeat protein [candidate division KSB1 bacterium]|nr:PQQ-like beta-propeller repeat protein [candidate division KSB1 bacterium]
MKRKILIVSLIVVLILAIGGFFMFRMVMKHIQGEEEFTGTLQAIPEAIAQIPPLNKGDSDWPNWRGPNFDGKSSLIGIKKDLTAGLRKLWEVNYLCQDKFTVSWAAPVIQGNRLVVPGRDENHDFVFCLESNSGELLWMGKYAANVKSNHGAGSRATPFIDADRVYTFGRSGVLTCWQLEDGKLLWKQDVTDIGGLEPEWGHSSSPLVYQDKVIVQGGGNALVAAYNKITGELAWKSMQGTGGYAAPVLANFGGEMQLVIFQGTGLSFLKADDGTELWSLPWKTDYDVNATTPVIVDSLIFITSGYKTGGELIKMGEDSGTVLWKNKAIASHHSDPILIDGHLYGYSGFSTQNKGDFVCLELTTGQEKWRTGEIGWGTTAYVDGHLLCLDIEGNLFLVKPDPNQFIKVSELKSAIENVKNPAWTIPVVANGKLYLRYMQRLVCYDLMAGN